MKYFFVQAPVNLREFSDQMANTGKTFAARVCKYCATQEWAGAIWKKR